MKYCTITDYFSPSERHGDADGNGQLAPRPAGVRQHSRRLCKFIHRHRNLNGKRKNVNVVLKRIFLPTSSAVISHHPLPAEEPVPLALHAQSRVPPRREATRPLRRRKHADQGEEATQPGRDAGHHHGTRSRIPADGESLDWPGTPEQ